MALVKTTRIKIFPIKFRSPIAKTSVSFPLVGNVWKDGGKKLKGKNLMLPFLLFLFMVFAGSLWGCATYSTNADTIEDLHSQIKVGVTAQEQISSNFGHPTWTYWTTINDQPTEVWNYFLVTATTHPLLSVPIVGPLIVQSNNAVESENWKYTFYFSEGGILRGMTREIRHSDIEAEMQADLDTKTKDHSFSFISPEKGHPILSAEALQEIQLYHSTKNEVERLLGTPTTISTIKTAEGVQLLWTYFYTNSNALAGEYQGSSHRILFDTRDVVIGLNSMDHAWIKAPLDFLPNE